MSIENSMNRIGREAGIKRCIILEGNVNDVFLQDRKILPVKDCLKGVLESVGYNDIVRWDSVTGIQDDILGMRLVDDDEEQTGDEYDLGDIEVPEQSSTGACREFGDMLSTVLRTMKDPASKTAFILDWSDYVFSAGQMDPNDRANLTLLGKSLRDLVPKYSSESVRRSVVILITAKSSMVPLSLYSGNPEVSIITLSKPDMVERRRMLERISIGFSVKGGDILNSDRFEDYVDMMNDFTNREMIQMANMSRTGDRMTFDKLYYLFRYGEKENPWEKLEPQKVRRIKKILSERVIGQERAIDRVEDTIVKAFMGVTGIHKASSRSMPKGVFFFVGPTGVGKTELSKVLAKFLFGDESACIRFDMSEYSHENSDQKLIGAPPGYVGYEEGGQLTNAIREKPFSVVLFDEIEKAAKPNPRILDIFLQILEDGRLTDSRGETTYFSDTVIIFTSNLGASEVKNIGDDDKIAKEFIDVVKNYFDNELKRPEILGRIGYENIVPFNFINDPEFAKNIVRSKMKPIISGLHEKYKMDLEVANELAFYNYVLEGADVAKGGRDILNALDSRLLTPLAKFLFENYDDLGLMKNSTLRVSVKDGKARFDLDE